MTQVEVPFEALQDPEAIANWPRTLGRDGARTPMPWTARGTNAGFSAGKPWLPVGADHPGLSAEVQEGDADSVLRFTRRLLAVRSASEALRLGSAEFVDAPGELLVMIRAHGAERVTCIFNLGPDAVEVPEQVSRQGEVLASAGWQTPPASAMVPPYAFALLKD